MKKYREIKLGKKKFPTMMAVLIIIALIALLVSFFGYINYKPNNSGFDVNRILIKSVVNEKDALNNVFKITNLNERKNFIIEINNLEKIISLSDNNFSLSVGESKEITSSLKSNSLPGIYIGSLKIKGDKGEKIIPTVIEIQSPDPYFAINFDINPKYKDIQKKGEITSNINFYNLKDSGTHNVEINYLIISQNGESKFSEKENISLGSRYTLTKRINMPEKIISGNYIFAVILNFDGSISTSTFLFDISNQKVSLDFINPNLMQISIFVLLFLIIIIIIYILIERNEILSKLKRQQKSELEFYSKGIEKQKKISLKKAESEKERGKIFNEFKDAKNKIIRKIKDIQKKQVDELSKLKEKKDKKYLENKVKKWRKEIYPKALKSVEISSELKRKLRALERAYSEGYISEESYKKGKSRIESEGKK